MSEHIDSDFTEKFKQHRVVLPFHEEITENSKVTVVEPLIIDENTTVSMLEYNAAIDSLTTKIEEFRNYIAVLQRENTRLKRRWNSCNF